MNAAPIYERPEIYDLEHLDDGEDVAFFLKMATRLQPRRILEWGCGSGRITCALSHCIARWGGLITGLDASAEMLTTARGKPNAGLVDWQEGDLRSWQATEPYDWILSPCAATSHLLSLEDQLAAWRNARANLIADGQFTVVENMPDYLNLADSMHHPPRLNLLLDGDSYESETGAQLLRYRATRYDAVEQNSAVHFLYDHTIARQEPVERLISVQKSHVYFPRELHLLFLASNLSVQETLGDWKGGRLTQASRQIIMTGRKASDTGLAVTP